MKVRFCVHMKINVYTEIKFYTHIKMDIMSEWKEESKLNEIIAANLAKIKI